MISVVRTLQAQTIGFTVIALSHLSAVRLEIRLSLSPKPNRNLIQNSTKTHNLFKFYSTFVSHT